MRLGVLRSLNPSLASIADPTEQQRPALEPATAPRNTRTKSSAPQTEALPGSRMVMAHARGSPDGPQRSHGGRRVPCRLITLSHGTSPRSGTSRALPHRGRAVPRSRGGAAAARPGRPGDRRLLAGPAEGSLARQCRRRGAARPRHRAQRYSAAGADGPPLRRRRRFTSSPPPGRLSPATLPALTRGRDGGCRKRGPPSPECDARLAGGMVCAPPLRRATANRVADAAWRVTLPFAAPTPALKLPPTFSLRH